MVSQDAASKSNGESLAELPPPPISPLSSQSNNLRRSSMATLSHFCPMFSIPSPSRPNPFPRCRSTFRATVSSQLSDEATNDFNQNCLKRCTCFTCSIFDVSPSWCQLVCQRASMIANCSAYLMGSNFNLQKGCRRWAADFCRCRRFAFSVRMLDWTPNVLLNVTSCMYSVKGPSMVKTSYPTVFPLNHQQKDLRLALGLAESVSQLSPIAVVAHESYKVAKFHGHGDQDFSDSF